MKTLLIKFGRLIRGLGKSIQPDYWVCSHCGCIKFKEEEIVCWKCGECYSSIMEVWLPKTF